ncbi:MAG: ABC transporter ATP-binding protein [Proteobacteria bacterium]|nr:ABC transporter ATP-binding protein [Pseudomonadota bacterium]
MIVGTSQHTAAAAGAAVELDDIAVAFATPSGAVHTVLRDVSLAVAEGSFTAIVGPSGCGKTTLLNVAAGLFAPPGGEVRVFGEALGGLAGFEDRFPYQLSGGMKKRVAIAQSWIVDPRILLMDEPFGALDVQTRQNMENELLGLWQETRKTVLFITHDLEEAIALADQVVVMSAGPAARIKGRYAVNLPRPRDVAEIRLNADFVALYSRIWDDLRDEVKRSQESPQ